MAKQPSAKKPAKAATIKDLVAAPPSRPSSDAFLDHFFAHAGGPEAVAKLLWDEFLSSPAGSMLRQRTLELVLRQLERSERNKGIWDDIGHLSDADLDRLAEAREKLLAQHLTTSPTDAAPPGPGRPDPPPRGPGGAPAEAASRPEPGPPAGPAPAAPAG